MKFLSDYTEVAFSGLEHKFDVYATFCEFQLPFSGNTVSIKFYGLIIAFGFLLAVLFGGRLAYKWKIDLNKMVDVLIWGTIGGIIGARLYYVIFEWDYYSVHPDQIIKVWEGGLAIYGGLIGGIFAAYFTCKRVNLNFLKLLDMASMSFLIGQGIGRWGNFANQEAFGTNTSMPWGMFSQKTQDYLIENQLQLSQKGIYVDPLSPVHPTFLYESVWCILGFILLYYILKHHYKFAGQMILCYGVVYGMERAVVEGFRTDSLYIANTTIRISQVLSAVVAVLCLVILMLKLYELKKNPKEYNPVEVLPKEKDYEIDDSKEKEKEANRNVAKMQKAKIKKEEQKLKEKRKNGKNH